MIGSGLKVKAASSTNFKIHGYLSDNLTRKFPKNIQDLSLEVNISKVKIAWMIRLLTIKFRIYTKLQVHYELTDVRQTL